MVAAREIMHPGAECVREGDTLQAAAQQMRDLHVGALPICGEDQRLKGIITDRDLVIRCVAEGKDPSTMTAGELATGAPVWVDAAADQQEVVRLLAQHRIRRLPVLENRQLVGIISEADVVTHLSEPEITEFTQAIYSAPPSS